MALGCRGDKLEGFGDPGDPIIVTKMGIVDGSCKAVKVPFVTAQGYQGETVASVLSGLDICFCRVVGGGLNDHPE